MKTFTIVYKYNQEQKNFNNIEAAQKWAGSQYGASHGKPKVFEQQSEFPFSYQSDNLQQLVEKLKIAGVTDFSKVEFELDNSDCYYESDSPSVQAIYKIQY